MLCGFLRCAGSPKLYHVAMHQMNQTLAHWLKDKTHA